MAKRSHWMVDLPPPSSELVELNRLIDEAVAAMHAAFAGGADVFVMMCGDQEIARIPRDRSVMWKEDEA